MSGTLALGPDITIHEGEEGAVEGIDNLTEDEEVVGGGHRNAHKKDSRNGVVLMTTPPTRHLRVVSVNHTLNNRATEALLGNGTTVHR